MVAIPRSFPRVVRALRMLAMVLKWLTDFFTGAIIETRKTVRSKVAASSLRQVVKLWCMEQCDDISFVLHEVR